MSEIQAITIARIIKENPCGTGAGKAIPFTEAEFDALYRSLPCPSC